MNKKKILISVGGLFVALISYYLSIQVWLWKWEQPHNPLPENHLAHVDVSNFSGKHPDVATMAQREMTILAETLQSVSISGALSMKGEMVWAGSIGLAKVAPETPATINTQYRIGSISKPITAVTLMRMKEEERIDLDAPIETFLPEYPRYRTPMTARQLASHTAGVRHYTMDLTAFPPTDAYSNTHYEGVTEALTPFMNDDLLFSPGKGYNYSTHGYTLLSAVMEKAGGERFDQLVAELVLIPLGMNATAGEHLLKDTQNLAEFYSSDDGLYGETPAVNLSNKLAGGGFVSTPTDLVRLGTALLAGQILSRESFIEMTTPVPLFDGSESPQGTALGWRHYETKNILGEENMVDVIHHGGVSTGADSYLLMVPAHDIVIAFASNGQGRITRGELQLLAYRLAAAIIKSKQNLDE